MTTAAINTNERNGEAVRRFHRRMPGYAASPLRVMRSFGRAGGPTVLVKDESSRLELPAFKILGASWAVYRKIESELGITLDDWEGFADLVRLAEPLRPRSLIAATDGNHGRAVARMAKLLGFSSRIFLPAETVPARKRGIASEGAEVLEVDGTFDEAVVEAAEAARADGAWLMLDTSTEGDERIAQWVIEGYTTMMQEIDESITQQNLTPPNVVFVQIGVGALAAAVVRHFSLRRAGVAPAEQVSDLQYLPAIIGVEASCAACAHESAAKGALVSVPGPHNSIMAGLNCGTLSGVAWPELRESISEFIAIEDTWPRLAMRSAAAAGITMGESGAASLAGLIDVMENPERTTLRDRLALDHSSTVLVINTEGATDPVSYDEIVGTQSVAQASSL